MGQKEKPKGDHRGFGSISPFTHRLFWCPVFLIHSCFEKDLLGRAFSFGSLTESTSKPPMKLFALGEGKSGKRFHSFQGRFFLAKWGSLGL